MGRWADWECLKQTSDKTLFKLNISEMVSMKCELPLQYEEINIGGNSDDLHHLCKKVDRYILHIVEEIIEFLDEFKYRNTNEDIKDNKNCMMELIDVIGYITSLLCIFEIDYYGWKQIRYGENKYPLELTINIDNFNLENDPIDVKVKNTLLQIEGYLINGVRRQFPERKWHKDTDRVLSIKELEKLYKDCIADTINALLEAVSMFLYLTDCDVSLFHKLFVKKHNEAYSLKNKN